MGSHLQRVNRPVIGYVSQKLQLDPQTEVEGPAYKAGIQAGDEVISLMVALRVISMKCSIPLLRALEGTSKVNPKLPLPSSVIRKLDLIIEPALITINPASGDKVRQIGIQPATHIVSQLVENSPATRRDLNSTTVLSLNGKAVYSIPAIREILRKDNGKAASIGILRRTNILSSD